MITQGPLFSAFLDRQIGLEGGYSDPARTGLPDAGGVTIWGVTEATARAWGYVGDMRVMPRDTALAIYQTVFVARPGFDLLGVIDAPIALKLCEIGIMSAPETATKMLQRALNALSEGGRSYATTALDGNLGRVTRTALATLIGARGADARHVLLAMVTAMQSVFLVELCERAPSQKTFEYGWQLNRVVGGQLRQIGAAGGAGPPASAAIAAPTAATAAALRSIS